MTIAAAPSAHARLKVLLAGLFSQLLCLGIARFAYTPLLPMMQEQTWLTDSAAGWLATVNYAGYMLGALIAASVSKLSTKDTLYRIGLVIGVVSTAATGMTESMLLWAVLRFFAGLSSAAAMLIASGLILNWLLRNRFRSELGLHFAGIGLGIVFVAVTVEIMLRMDLAWHVQWEWLAVMGAILAVPAWFWMPRPEKDSAAVKAQSLVDRPPPRLFLWVLMVAYFCAGYGFVISSTFIVTIVERQSSLAGSGALVFLVLGAAGVPAVFFWDYLARRIGVLYALFAAYIVKAIGIVLPALGASSGGSLVATIVGAALFGASVVGCVCLVLTMVGRFYPTMPAKLMGKLTMAYGVAQIIAPALTGSLAQMLGSYDLGLWIAGGFVVTGAALVMVLTRIKAGYESLV